MERFVNFYNNLSNFCKLLISSLSIAIPFYFAAFLKTYIAESLKLNDFRRIILDAVIIIIGLASVITISKIFKFYQERLMHEKETERATLFQAYTLCDRVITNRLKNIRKDKSENGYQDYLITNNEALQELINAAYQTFESTYGKNFIDNDRINFEVTFMTKSYIDNMITIPASANKDGRSPLSMLLRKDKPNIYENTVTASVYRETRASTKIIEDTTCMGSGYEEIYANQLDRIKSSIIFPVFSHSNELLGTLVVHCDKQNFFKYNKIKYWTNLLEIFAKRLAFEKSKLDLINYLRSENILTISLNQTKPF